MEIIPAIDLIGGKCVRLKQGDYAQQTTYNDDPLEVAKTFEGAGIRRLHLVDLDGAKAGKLVNLNVLERLATHTKLTIDVGGGIKTTDDARRVLSAGAAMFTAGSIAVRQPEVVLDWITTFGRDKIILGADAKNRKIAAHGWQEDTGVDLFEFLTPFLNHGLSQVICTDIALDGMMCGPSFELYTEMLATFPSLQLIASGGVSCFDDLLRLQSMRMHGAIVGKAFYEGAITLTQLASLVQSQT